MATHFFLLNVDTKIISKAFSERLKNVFSGLVSTQQIAYIKNRFIKEGGRLISDIVDICDQYWRVFSYNRH